MKLKRNTLTDRELLILLKENVSDVDLDVSDDELDFVSNINEHAIPKSPVVGPGNDRSAGGVRREFGC